MGIKEDLLTDKANKYRGTILNAMANVEFLLNTYLARYFCGNDQEKIEEIIVIVFGDDRTTLNSKAQMFAHIATKHDKKWYTEYKSIRKSTESKKPYSLNSDLAYIIQERNVFAHRVFSADGEVAGRELPINTLRFIKFKNDIEPLDYDDGKLMELITLIMKIGVHFSKKLEELGLLKK